MTLPSPVHYPHHKTIAVESISSQSLKDYEELYNNGINVNMIFIMNKRLVSSSMLIASY